MLATNLHYVSPELGLLIWFVDTAHTQTNPHTHTHRDKHVKTIPVFAVAAGNLKYANIYAQFSVNVKTVIIIVAHFSILRITSHARVCWETFQTHELSCLLAVVSVHTTRT